MCPSEARVDLYSARLSCSSNIYGLPAKPIFLWVLNMNGRDDYFLNGTADRAEQIRGNEYVIHEAEPKWMPAKATMDVL